MKTLASGRWQQVWQNWFSNRFKRWKEVVPGTTQGLFLESFSRSAPPHEQLLWKAEAGEPCPCMFCRRAVNVSNLGLSSWRARSSGLGKVALMVSILLKWVAHPGGEWWWERLPSGVARGSGGGSPCRAAGSGSSQGGPRESQWASPRDQCRAMRPKLPRASSRLKTTSVQWTLRRSTGGRGLTLKGA